MDPTLLKTTGCMCLAARRASRTITRRFNQAFREHDLTATQFTLLAALALAGDKAINELAEMLGNERTTITRNLARAEQQRWVRITPDSRDARSRRAAIAPAGRKKLAAALPAWSRTQQQLVDELGEDAAAGLRVLAGGPCLLDPKEIALQLEEMQP